MGRKAANKQDGKRGRDEDAACGPHVAFYKGGVASGEGTLEELLAWKGNYKKLEENHAYIQWLFPNYFDSKFNSESQALSRDEAKAFREDSIIARNYVKSYKLFLDFLGIQLLDERTGTVGRAPGGVGRTRKALVQNIHNHLRVRRVLASLAVMGFQRYLSPLVSYLSWEITGSTDQLLALGTDLSRITRGERPVLTELAAPASRNEKSFLVTLSEFVDGNAVHFREVTKASTDDCGASIFLVEKDKKVMLTLSKAANDEQACPYPDDDQAKGKQSDDTAASVCICCEGRGAIIVIGVCPLCDGLGVIT